MEWVGGQLLIGKSRNVGAPALFESIPQKYLWVGCRNLLESSILRYHTPVSCYLYDWWLPSPIAQLRAGKPRGEV